MSFSSSLARISASTCRPSFLGNCMSSRIRFGVGAWAKLPLRKRKLIASSPSQTRVTRHCRLPHLRACIVTLASSRLSSTRRISILSTASRLMWFFPSARLRKYEHYSLPWMDSDRPATQKTKKPTWRNTRRYSTTSAYSSTNLSARPSCSSSSHPTPLCKLYKRK